MGRAMQQNEWSAHRSCILSSLVADRPTAAAQVSAHLGKNLDFRAPRLQFSTAVFLHIVGRRSQIAPLPDWQMAGGTNHNKGVP